MWYIIQFIFFELPFMEVRPAHPLLAMCPWTKQLLHTRPFSIRLKPSLAEFRRLGRVSFFPWIEVGVRRWLDFHWNFLHRIITGDYSEALEVEHLQSCHSDFASWVGIGGAQRPARDDASDELSNVESAGLRMPIVLPNQHRLNKSFLSRFNSKHYIYIYLNLGCWRVLIKVLIMIQF